MPYLRIIKINGKWHIPMPSDKITECGEIVNTIEDKQRIGGDTATISPPPKELLCDKCFKFRK